MEPLNQNCLQPFSPIPRHSCIGTSSSTPIGELNTITITTNYHIVVIPVPEQE